MKTPVCMRNDAVMLGDQDMTDEIVVGSLVFNKDKSITVSAQINVYHPDGRLWTVFRDIRMPLDSWLQKWTIPDFTCLTSTRRLAQQSEMLVPH